MGPVPFPDWRLSPRQAVARRGEDRHHRVGAPRCLTGGVDAPMTVSLSQLRQVLNRLLDDVVERNGGDEIELDADYYWMLDPLDTYNASESPTAARMTLGQLSDDLVELTAMAATSDPAVIWHDLAHVVGILQWLAVRDRP